MRIADATARLILFSGWWGILSRGDLQSWVVGAPVVIAATLLSGALSPALSWRGRPAGALRFAGFFLGHSFLGGVDVARRVFHPRLPLRPGFIEIRLRLPAGAARVWLANIVSLQPGTLAAELDGDRLVVHTVDTGTPVTLTVRSAEKRVADMLGVALQPEEGGQS